MSWLRNWTKPVYRRRWHGWRGYWSPFTDKPLGISRKVGPVSFTDSGRIYLWGARIR